MGDLLFYFTEWLRNTPLNLSVRVSSIRDSCRVGLRRTGTCGASATGGHGVFVRAAARGIMTAKSVVENASGRIY